MDERGGDTGEPVETTVCQFNDDDLLVSVFIKSKIFRSTSNCSIQNGKPVRERMSQRSSSRLHERCPKIGPRHSRKIRWFATGSRTVLSWLINAGAVSRNEEIRYQNPIDDSVTKEGLFTEDGVVCLCCNRTLSISEFKSHAESEIDADLRSNEPCTNLVMASGKPLTLCQLEAWSAEYRARKVPLETRQVDEGDELCGFCGHEGELVCCDNCPAAFHQACLFDQLPEGNWYCSQCRCPTCWNVVNDKDPSLSSGNLKCSMCKHKYHEACTKGEYVKIGSTSYNWFCGQSCQEIYEGLHSLTGSMNHISDGISWKLLKCMDGDHKAHASPHFVPLKAEYNSRLAVALTLLEEYFLQMEDRVTKIDMIPQIIYNWGSQFPRLNFEGFYTVVLETKEVVVSVASLRIHNVQVAELPFIATCRKSRMKGFCRLLVNHIEQMLGSLKIMKLFIPAAGPESMDMWINKFGFRHLEGDERRSFRKTNLMVLPGSTWLVKSLQQ